MEVIKIDDNQIEVTKTETKEIKNTFVYEYLISQREAIQKLKDEQIAQRDIELAEIDAILVECERLNVTAKVVEPIV